MKLLLAGDEINSEKYVMSHLTTMKPIEVTQTILTKAMEEIGNLYGQNKIFLPHLILAAETVKPIFNKLLDMIEDKETIKLGKILLATVEGDIHDIGKK